MWRSSCLVLSVLGIIITAYPSIRAQPVSRANDLYCTDITPVTDDTRYTTIYPDVPLTEMTKVKHSKGNVVFTSGERTSGDRLIINHYDDESFASAVDIEVLMRYPAESSTGVTLTCIEVYVDMSADDAGGYITKGGIGKTVAEILLTANLTRSFVYETFIYGY